MARDKERDDSQITGEAAHILKQLGYEKMLPRLTIEEGRPGPVSQDPLPTYTLATENSNLLITVDTGTASSKTMLRDPLQKDIAIFFGKNPEEDFTVPRIRSAIGFTGGDLRNPLFIVYRKIEFPLGPTWRGKVFRRRGTEPDEVHRLYAIVNDNRKPQKKA